MVALACSPVAKGLRDVVHEPPRAMQETFHSVSVAKGSVWFLPILIFGQERCLLGVRGSFLLLFPRAALDQGLVWLGLGLFFFKKKRFRNRPSAQRDTAARGRVPTNLKLQL